METKAVTQATGMLAIIEKFGASPDVDVAKLEKMLEMQERIMAKQAEIDFTESMTRMKPNLPAIDKNGTILFTDKNGNERRTPHARYEDIQEAINPHLVKEGFSISFDTEAVPNAPTIIKCTLSHRGGYSKTNSLPLPLDTSGSKNNLQAMGSTILYGKRYLVGMMLDLVIKGVDDDGKGADKTITDEHAAEIKRLMQERNADVKKFLEFVKAKDVDSMLEADYLKARSLLLSKPMPKTEEVKK